MHLTNRSPSRITADPANTMHTGDALPEEILSCKLSCRQNIVDTFTTKQRDTLPFLLTERQMVTVQ
jgi:hypothetical protein